MVGDLISFMVFNDFSLKRFFGRKIELDSTISLSSEYYYKTWVLGKMENFLVLVRQDSRWEVYWSL